jgi:hypothetical protein
MAEQHSFAESGLLEIKLAMTKREIAFHLNSLEKLAIQLSKLQNEQRQGLYVPLAPE